MHQSISFFHKIVAAVTIFAVLINNAVLISAHVVLATEGAWFYSLLFAEIWLSDGCTLSHPGNLSLIYAEAFVSYWWLQVRHLTKTVVVVIVFIVIIVTHHSCPHYHQILSHIVVADRPYILVCVQCLHSFLADVCGWQVAILQSCTTRHLIGYYVLVI